MLNTTQVKELVKQRFGGSIKQVYLNKCYSNKQELADKRNMAFAVDGDVYKGVDLTALAQEIGCKRITTTRCIFKRNAKRMLVTFTTCKL